MTNKITPIKLSIFLLLTLTACNNNQKIESKNKELINELQADIEIINSKLNKQTEISKSEIKKQIEINDSQVKISKIASSYLDLYNEFTSNFINSLNTNLTERIISDRLLTELVNDVMHQEVRGAFSVAIAPYNYVSLFKPELRYVEHKKLMDELDSHNNFDNIFFNLKYKIEDNLRKYFSKPANIKNFYHCKKQVIINAIESSNVNDNYLLLVLNNSIKSFELILDAKYRKKFDSYLDLETKFVKAPELKDPYYRQNSYDKRDTIYKDVLDGFSISEISTTDKLKKDFYNARIYLFNTSKIPKLTAFSYRRYQEGGIDLVKEYIGILKDLQLTLKNKN